VNVKYQHPIKVVSLSTCALLLGITTLRAEPVSYDESVDGDLSDVDVEMPVFNFDVGINTVSGSSHFSADNLEFHNWDSDPFKFYVLPSQKVSSITFSFTVTHEENDFWIISPLSYIAGESGSVYLGEDAALISSPAEVPSSPAILYTNVLPLGPGLYEYHSSGYQLGWICNPLGEVSDLPDCLQDITESAYVAYDYTLTFEVESVADGTEIAAE
jgi:hypothetical protein